MMYRIEFNITAAGCLWLDAKDRNRAEDEAIDYLTTKLLGLSNDNLDIAEVTEWEFRTEEAGHECRLQVDPQEA